MQEVGRQRALQYLFDRCGFQFDEVQDLSPETRQRIGELARSLLGVDESDSRIQAERARGMKGTPLAGVPALFGILLVVAGVASPIVFATPLTGALVLGFVLLVLVSLASRSHKHGTARTVARIQKERDEKWTAWAAQADAPSAEILEEARAAYRQKVRPRVIEVKVDFAELVRAAQGKGIVLDKIGFPSCAAAVALPASGDAVKCAYCGTTVTATNVLERMKSLLA